MRNLAASLLYHPRLLGWKLRIGRQPPRRCYGLAQDYSSQDSIKFSSVGRDLGRESSVRGIRVGLFGDGDTEPVWELKAVQSPPFQPNRIQRRDARHGSVTRHDPNFYAKRQDRSSFCRSLRSLAYQSTAAHLILHQVDSFILRNLKRENFSFFFVCDSILDDGHISLFYSGLSFTNMSRSLPCQEIFFCRIQMSSRCMFSYWALHYFYVLSLFLFDRSLRNNIDSLDFQVVKAHWHTPGARRLSILRVTQKPEIPNACSVPGFILRRSEIGSRSRPESTNLLPANGLISHPRSFDFFPFPFPYLGPGWPP